MMVRLENQYEFIYDVLFEALLTHHAIVSDDVNVCYRLLNRVNPHTNNSYFHEQFKVVVRMSLRGIDKVEGLVGTEAPYEMLEGGLQH